MEHFWKYTHTTRQEKFGIVQEVYHYECLDCGKKKTRPCYTSKQATAIINEQVEALEKKLGKGAN